MNIGEIKRCVDLIYDCSVLYKSRENYEIVIALDGKPNSGRQFVRISGIEEGLMEEKGKFFFIAEESIKRTKDLPVPKQPPKPIEELTDIDKANLEIQKLKKEIIRLRNKLIKVDSTPETRKNKKRLDKDGGEVESVSVE